MEGEVNSAQLFTLAVTALPAATRDRLDGAAPLDWGILENPQTGEAMADAVQEHRPLPQTVESLVQRLVEDVGVVPQDLAAGVERAAAVGRWIRDASLEPDGESYRVRDHRSGRVHAGIRPEAVAGYATLALELATAVAEAAERWIRAGGRHSAAVADDASALDRCAALMSARLQSRCGTDSGQVATSTVANTLSDAWNSQSLQTREELSTGLRLHTAYAAYPPRKRYLSPISSYRLHAYDLGEIRWLRALAERANSGTGIDADEHVPPRRTAWPDRTPEAMGGRVAPMTGEPASPPDLHAEARTEEIAIADPDSDDLALGRQLAELERAASGGLAFVGAADETTFPEASTLGSAEPDVPLDLTALQAEIGGGTQIGPRLGLGSDNRDIDRELSRLEDAASRFDGTVRRRMAESYGIGVTQALTRLRDPREKEAVRNEISKTVSEQRAPLWIEDLAAILLIDAGAETDEGLRTEGLQLDSSGDRNGGYLATQPETGLDAHLSLPGLLRQVHLGLDYVDTVSAALHALRHAGKEAGWTLTEQGAASAQLEESERDKLEAAQQIERALDRIVHARVLPGRAPTALEEASMLADALTAVGPPVRASAGWPGSEETPNGRRPGDVARMAAVAQALHDDVRSISNRLIAGQLADDEPPADRPLG